METDVIDVDDYNKRRFLERFKLQNFERRMIVKVNKIEQLPPVYQMYFEEYDVDISIVRLSFNLNIKSSKHEKDNIIRKMTITIFGDRFKDELTSCVNYLQRKRNLHHALEMLSCYINLDEQRQYIGTYLMEEIGNYLSLSYRKEDGFKLTCCDMDMGCRYFETDWRIWWNCRDFTFYDNIAFAVNKENIEFYSKTRSIMLEILKPTSDVTVKLRNWTLIMAYLKYSIEQSKRVPRREVNNNNNIDYIDSAAIEISDSETEDEVFFVGCQTTKRKVLTLTLD